MPATYSLTTTVDIVDANDGFLSLREAVLAANATVGVADTISLTAGSYRLTLSGTNEDAAATGDLDVTDKLTIQGAGTANTIVDGNQADRVFDLRSGSLTLIGLTVRNGNVTGNANQAQGGGIRSFGTLQLIDCAVTGCQSRSNDVNATGTGADLASGGGLYCASAGGVTLIRTTVANNQAIGGTASGQGTHGGGARGGGLYRIGGSMTLTESAVTDNQALGGPTNAGGGATGGHASGGGIYYEAHLGISEPTGAQILLGNVTIYSTTIGGNRAVGGTAGGPAGGQGGDASGGGVYTSAQASLTDTAVVNNQVVGGSASLPFGASSGAAYGGHGTGGGICSSMQAYTPGSLTLTNSTISDNRVAGGAGTGGANGFGGDGIAGGVYTPGQCSISSCTLTLNTVMAGTGSIRNGTGVAGGVSSSGPDLIVGNTILAGNVAGSAPDLLRPANLAPVTSLGSNLVGIATNVSGLANGVNGDQVGGPVPIDPRLGPLANNGGRTPTHALLPDSPAIDRGANTTTRPYDQRGQGFTRAFGPADVGAFEHSDVGVPTATGALPMVTAPGSAPYQFKVIFWDDVAIAVSSIRTGAVRVVGPNGFRATPTFIRVDTSSDGPRRVATFELTPPGGAWDGVDAGLYTVSIVTGVTDTAGTAVPSGPLAGFMADLGTTHRVSNTNDSGPGSLRQAVLDANLTSAGDTIVFDPVVFGVPRTITLTSGMLNVHAPLTIAGPGAAILTISGNGSSRQFYLDGPGQMAVGFSGLTLAAGRANGRGGAILNVDEALTIENCAFTANSASEVGGAVGLGNAVSNLIIRGSSFTNNTAGDGGAVFVSNGSTLILDGCTFSGNSAVGYSTAPSTGSGGGIYFGMPMGPSTFQISNSTFANNSAALGGAIYVTALKRGAVYSLINCTLSGNSAAVDGGAIEVGTIGDPIAVLTLQSSTVTDNRTVNGATGGVSMQGTTPARLAITSSIIASNGAMSPDIGSAGTVDLTYSAVGSSTGFTPSVVSGNNLPFGSNLLLGPLVDNGGPTRTRALLAGSPAINAGSNAAGLVTDQRGIGFHRVAGAAADIGAFEAQPVAASSTVTSIVVNAGAQQRSMVNRVRVAFSAPITFVGQPSAAFRLSRIGPGQPTGDVTLAVDLSGSTPTQTVATLTFSGPFTEGLANSLVDGNYTLSVVSGQVNGGISGGDNVTSLYRRYGDVNSDRAVNGLDLAAFRGAFGTTSADPNYLSYLDGNGDGAINGLDLAGFRTRFGTILP